MSNYPNTARKVQNRNKSNFIHKLSVLRTPLKNRSREDQIERYGSRLSSYPVAVDTILIGMRAIKKDPSNQRYRIIDKAAKGYQNTLASVAAAEDLLLAIGFEAQGMKQENLVLKRVNDTLIDCAVTVLEKVRKTKSYKSEKKQIQFQKLVRDTISSAKNDDSSKKEIEARETYSKKVPPLPIGNSNVTMIHVNLLPELKLKRQFYGDDQLRDVLFWLGSISSEIPVKLMNGEWCLVDKITPDSIPLSCSSKSLNNTLQRIGIWPHGNLELRQSDTCPHSTEFPHAPRGLGVATSA